MDLMRLQNGGYPFTIESLHFMQDAYKKAFENLSKVAGSNVIIDGVEISGSDVSDGVIIYQGEVLPFVGGEHSATVIIYEQIGLAEYNEDADTDGNLDMKEAHVQRFARCGVGGVANFPFDSLKRVRSLENVRIPGEIMMYSGQTSSIPEGWLVANGQSLVKSDFPDLYANLGDVHGSTSTHFNIPDLRDRFIVGAGNDYSLADTGGSKEVTLTENQMPQHNHGGATVAAGNHTHGIDLKKGENDAGNLGKDLRRSVESGESTTVTTNQAGNHTHTISSSGGDQAHENRPPYYALSYLVFVGL